MNKPKLIAIERLVGDRIQSCSDKCHEAKTPVCKCICGGKYHGVANRPGAYEAMCFEVGLPVPNKEVENG